MRRHTVGIAHHQNEAVGAHCGPNEVIHQPQGGANYLHPSVFVPCAAAGTAFHLPHAYLPQDLSAVRGQDDDMSGQATCLSTGITDNNLLRPPQISG